MLQWEGAVGAAATLAEGPGANILLSIDMCRERRGKHVWQKPGGSDKAGGETG